MSKIMTAHNLGLDDLKLLSLPLAAKGLREKQLPVFPCSPYHVDSDDLLSKSILSFRDQARQRLLSEKESLMDIIGSKRPDLELFWRPREKGDPHTAWTWACELAKAYPLPLTVQLTGIFVAGIQMRVSRARTSATESVRLISWSTVFYSSM